MNERAVIPESGFIADSDLLYFFVKGKGEFTMEYCKYLPASQQVQAELMDRFNVDKLKRAKSR